MNPDSALIEELLEALQAPQYHFARLESYYAGIQPLAFLSPESRANLGNRLDKMVSNIPRVVIGTLAERLRVTGFTNPDVWPLWLDNDLHILADAAHRDALLLGTSFAIVWGNASGKPQVSIESAKQVTVLADPGSREITAGFKRWTTRTTTEGCLYLPDRVVRLSADCLDAVATKFNVVDEYENPLGVVPVVPIRNADRVPVGLPYYHPDRLLDYGHSEISDIVPLCDGLNKILTDLMISAEYCAKPRRFATGLELTEKPRLDKDGNPVLDSAGEPIVDTENPIPESNRTMVSESTETKFGQLSGADLSGYENAVEILMSQIMAVSGLSAHALGVWSDNPASADALRASESALTAKAENRQVVFGRAWDSVGRLMLAVQNGVDPATVDLQVQWNDPGTSSASQEADAITKLVAAGVLSRIGGLRRLGYSESEIQQELKDTAADTSSKADPNMKKYFGSQFEVETNK